MAEEINLNDLANTAKSAEKKIFVFLHTTDCGYCDSMIMFTLDDENIRDVLKKKFLLVDINVKHDNTVIYRDFKGSGYDFAKHIGYNFYPSSVFIDGHNKIIYGQVGYVEEDDFLITLQYISSGAYERMGLEEFQEDLD
mgnify:CR=1 FL=1